MNYSLRVTRVKKSNRAPLVFSVLALSALVLVVGSPLETFAATKIKPDLGVSLIIDQHLANQAKPVNLFYDAAVNASHSLIIDKRDSRADKTKRTTNLAMADTALLNVKPAQTKKREGAGAPAAIGSLDRQNNATKTIGNTKTAAPAATGHKIAKINLAATTKASANLTPPASKVPEPDPANATRKELPEQLVKPPGPRYGPERFYKGYCTEYVARYYDHGRGLAWYDNASAWLYRAKKAGWPTGSTPRVGAIMVTSEGGGHVALVESVNYNNKTFTVSEQNFVGFAVVSTRTVHFGAAPIKGFIY